MFRNRVSLFSGLVAGAVICMAVHPSLAYPQDTSAPTATATPQTGPAPGAQAPAKAQSLVPAVQAADLSRLFRQFRRRTRTSRKRSGRMTRLSP